MEYNKKVTIMDIGFLNASLQDLLHNYLFPRLNRKQKTFVVTANPEIVMKTRENAPYRKIIQSADYVIPDGAGIVMAAKYLKNPLPERIPGYDLMNELIKFAELQGLSCYFLGAKEYVNEKTIVEVEKKFPKLKIAGNHHGYIDINDNSIANSIASTEPDLIFVALGMPKQEQWIAKHFDKFHKGLFMGVGGSFDVLSGELKRAPQKWINLNLEWLYRFLKQPIRFRRLLKVFEFIFKVILRK
ncbi:WecB/TagA/CpsF family glycosyltransferase [Oceanobacillus massiliensis]|uniref:WecB/TagA/CpsF family glycosyltransferase n=1 Tax=Oceanobacillus massiliensis TaxID=1465765 RepID=UPI0030191B54